MQSLGNQGSLGLVGLCWTLKFLKIPAYGHQFGLPLPLLMQTFEDEVLADGHRHRTGNRRAGRSHGLNNYDIR